MKHRACDSPVPPVGDAYSLDDEDHHLAEKHKEEEEEAEGAVSPENKKTTNIPIKNYTSNIFKGSLTNQNKKI